MTDWQLLRDYVDQKSETAFTQLVDKHMKLVYGVCCRETGDPQVAEDAVQVVFLLLAQKAGSIRKETSMTGWLFNASRLISRNAKRREFRRRRIEQEAAMAMPKVAPPIAVWSQIDPYLNDALAALPDVDRQALLLRYFEGRSVREVADETGSTENTTTKRIGRALEKIRRFLANKDVAVSVALLSTLLAEHPAKSAPEACRTAALQAAHGIPKDYVAANSHVTALQKGVHFTMQTIRYKSLILGTALLVAVTGVGVPTALQIAKAQGPVSLNQAPPAASSPVVEINRAELVTKTNPKDGAEMIGIPAGSFKMGDDSGDSGNEAKLAHDVYLDTYYIYKNDVTVAMYRKFCDATGRAMPVAPSQGWIDTAPISRVTWDDANAYAQWAGVSLPTEAQWEKAARGTDGRTYPWGNEWDPSKCVNSVVVRPASGASPVGSIPSGASPYGVMDMAGNVWDWCADWYDAGYYAKSPVKNPECLIADSNAARVLRGGSWDLNGTLFFRSALRGSDTPTNSNYSDGFRCSSRPN